MPSLLRVVLSLLGVVHTFPARRHLALLVEHPSLGEAWKGVGAVVAVVLYFLPLRWYARTFAVLARHRWWAAALSALLVAAHSVPAADHLPRLFAHASWGDGWRGGGSALAVLWFTAPLRVQAATVAVLHAPRAILLSEKERFVMARVSLVLIAGLVFGAGVFTGARHVALSHAMPPVRAADAPAKVSATIVELHVPQAGSAIAIDGELEEAAWDGAARTGGFLRSDGSNARPYSDARLVWKDDTLYIALYAADEDIRTSASAPGPLDDAFSLFVEGTSGEHAIDVSADGRVFARRLSSGAPWEHLARVAHDMDGTANDASDDDEEWIVELAIPLRELGLKGERGERLSFGARRCDTPKHGHRACGAWNAGEPAVLVLD
ncbi:carbohydrate-binding family 9-like protein [Labilithrix luteola]|nr:carbohydrate-binding family 9-like protein [Labilithrix luteola]